MKVFDNIASPLKLRGEKNIDARVRELASRLHIEMFSRGLPAELSAASSSAWRWPVRWPRARR